MSHYTVMVKYEGNIEDAEEIVSEMLESYDENKTVEPYIKYEKSKEKIYLKDKIDEFKRIVSSQNKDYNLEYCEKELKRLESLTPSKHFKEISEGYEFDKNGNAIATYNPDSKWDWYSIGGRWSGTLKLKKGKKGKEGRAGVFNNPTGIDIAYAKDIDWKGMKKFSTYAVLDENGWHEYAEMGWFGMSHSEIEDERTWHEKFKERFIDNCTDETVIVIVDCHI